MFRIPPHQRTRVCDIAKLCEADPDDMVVDRLLECSTIHDRRAFVTGSRAYGVTNSASDLDLVVYVSKEDLALLIKCCDSYEERYGPGRAGEDHPTFKPESISIRFGDLNLICVTSDEWFEAWQDGTEELKEKSTTKPQTRLQAIGVFQRVFSQRGLIPGD